MHASVMEISTVIRAFSAIAQHVIRWEKPYTLSQPLHLIETTFLVIHEFCTTIEGSRC